jgi:predicted nucleic acid-binding protein
VTWLLDTDRLSLGSPAAACPPAADAFRGWLARNGERLFLSAVSLAEIAHGIERLVRRGSSRKAELLGAWRDDLLAFHQSRVIDLDPRVARRAGELLAVAESQGHQPGLEVIAATADCHGLTLLTRNLRHYRPMNVACADPLAGLPD